MTIPTERVRELRAIHLNAIEYALDRYSRHRARGAAGQLMPGPNEYIEDLRAICDELLARRDAEAREGWQPIETAPWNESITLYTNAYVPMYFGRLRYGTPGEPQQDEFRWRCDSSGRFSNPTMWRRSPPPPVPNVTGEKL